MTQDEFFGAIESNLARLAASHAALPPRNKFFGLFWRNRVKQVLNLTKDDASAPANVRCYDLVASRRPVAGRCRFRIFASYADAATHEGCRSAKFAIRKWYQESGRASSSEQPYAGALIVGAPSPWPEGMSPNADDMPFANVTFRMLAATHPQPERGVQISRDGDCESCVQIFRALVPETFDKVERRVRDCVKRSLLPDGTCVGGGILTVRKVMDELPMLPADVVAGIFNKMQAEGTHRIGTRKGKDMSGADRIYIEGKPPSWWRRMLSRRLGD